MENYMKKSKLQQVPNTKQKKPAQVSSLQTIDNNLHLRPIVTATSTHEDIARRAYKIYVDTGSPWGHSEQNWLQAEREQMKANKTVTLLNS